MTIGSKIIGCCLVLAAITFGGCRTVDVTELPPTLRVATWNLEHLAATDGVGCRPRTEADYQALREHADRLYAGVVAFQEVENAAAAARVFPPDGWIIVMSDRPDSGRSSPCREGSTLRIRKQDVGFAIRRGLPFRRNPDVRSLAFGDPDLRWGVDITLLTPRPLRLLAVHLKSGCNSGSDVHDRDCQIIFTQAAELENWIDERARANEDFAVLGDWNRRTGIAGDAFLQIVSDDDPPGGRLALADAGRASGCIQRYRDFIDHIGLGARALSRLVPGSFVEYLYRVSEDQYPADHCPQYVDLMAD